MSVVFLSYRRDDSPDGVARIYEALKNLLPNQEIFRDIDSMRLGAKFPDRLREKLAVASAIVVIIGPRWLEILNHRKTDPVDYVRNEIRIALESEAKVIPVTVGGAKMPSEADLGEFPDLLRLTHRNGMAIRSDPGFADDIVNLVKGIATAESVGSVLEGKYKLIRWIGKGGMGTVFIAEQTQPVRRQVAVKLINQGMDTQEVLRRFTAEQQALAVMNHPNIARVLDAGKTLAGRPYFVMEFVKGVPITEYCDAKKLNPRERLALFGMVCHAVQHAHQKGIIHRDLKPSNILVEVVDGKPVPKVIDFGLAKAMGLQLSDSSVYPESGQRIGTPTYMSPEQAEGLLTDIDTRSDIYSLGVLLYELLTGDTPFSRGELEKMGENERRRVIREDEPPIPSTRLGTAETLASIAASRQLDPTRLKKLIRGELDWITMKALEKDRTRRYETATDFARDVERYLADEVVEAQPPSVSYRARKFLRKNRGPVVAAGLVLIALFVGICGTIWQAGQKEAAKLREENERQQKEATEREAVLLRESMLHHKGLAHFSLARSTSPGDRSDPVIRARTEHTLKKGITALEEAHTQFPGHFEHAFFLGLSYISLAELTIVKGTNADFVMTLDFLDRAEQLFVEIRRLDPQDNWAITYFQEISAFSDANNIDDFFQITFKIIGVTRFLAYLCLLRPSESLAEFDRTYPQITVATPLIPPGGDAVEPSLADIKRMVQLTQLFETKINKNKVNQDDLVFFRTALLRAAEVEQSRMPWSTGPGLDHLKAIRLAAHLADSRGVAEPAVFNAACAFALASAAPDIDIAERDRRAAIAVMYLDRICQAGYFRHPIKGKLRRSEIVKDDALDSLRGRPDFRKVLAESQLIPPEQAPPHGR